MNTKQIFDCGERLFGKRTRLLSVWQEIAEHFMPERADFTSLRDPGQDFAGNLTTSYPMIARRDLGNAIGAMLRPTDKPWFHMRPTDDEREDIEARRWLERAESVQRRAMYDRITNFHRATSEGDHDFSAFGQCAISVEVTFDRLAGPHLLYRNWHLRDMAWSNNASNRIGMIFRKWKPDVRTLSALFKDKVHDKVKDKASKDPFYEVDCRHMVLEAEMVDGDFKTPYVSIYYDVENNHEIEKIGVWSPVYVIPRWLTVSGCQYAHSPAVTAALPEARLLQAMSYTLLEAGEKAVDPPMVGDANAIRADINLLPGGFTQVDRELDQRLIDILSPIPLDMGGIPLGIEMQRDSRAMIAEAMFLNKLAMPGSERKAEMTAFEVGQRVQEYIRQAMPIFGPMEMEYNGALCDASFELLMRHGAFGSPEDMPPSLQGADIQFRFESPLHDIIESGKAHKFMEASQLLAQAVAIDQTAGVVFDAKTALRDALLGTGVPARWNRSDQEMQAIEEQQAAAANAQAMLGTMEQGAGIVKTLSEATRTAA